MHLPTAGLVLQEVDRVAEALEQMHDGTPGLWKEGIIETGDEE